ncbi:hypothetical protein QYE76_058310 [Lolium multiflorum]|uniref:Uncharacterized protein n=1 Tax=Lolium multiflorum TaxID=4521 RepID=A0AAD8WPW6_LOLMU|nr:hypothetical protein QYE76_058310 [Lolium multiflorum]
MPPPLLQPYDPTRGLISCFTDDGLANDNISVATAETLRGLLVDIYEEAFRRLPVEDMPEGVDTAKLVDRGGLCLGLLDPVTNIVLNTISLLPEGFETTNPSTQANSGRSRPSRWSSHRRESTRDEWDAVAGRSSRCLLEFMRLYFGMLSEEQACRYLVWARADLAMAVLLVEHELYAARPAPPDPRSGRTRNSLRLAATRVNHPCPDQLVSLATAWLPLERLGILAPILRQEGRGNKFTVHDVKTVLQVLRHHISAMTTLPPSPTLEEGTTSCADLGDGRIAYITVVQRAGDHIASLRRPQDMDSTLSSYSTDAAPPGTMTNLPRDSPCLFVRSLEAADADVCPYVRSLEMSLYGAIHGFYLRALAMLPSHAARQHVRGVLLAGHCYGPMDPVSNIVLSAVWYDTNFPLPEADRRTQPHDILDTVAILRAMSRSLHGLVALLHATSGQRLPLHEILKYLCYAQCDLSVMLQPHLLQDGSCPNPFVAAATAAEHPQASSVAAFFASLSPTKLDKLRSLMTSATANNTALSRESLTQIHTILKEETPAMMIQRPLSHRRKLSNTALRILATKREAYHHQQSFLRPTIEQLLREYARSHPFEPKYELDFICGVALAEQRYHVNFMATSNSTFRNSLFFAEFRGTYITIAKTPFCCPLPQPYDMGCCYYGRESARKIAYPDHSIDYLSSGITHGGLDDTENTLDTDFLYFDSERDVELAKGAVALGVAWPGCTLALPWPGLCRHSRHGCVNIFLLPGLFASFTLLPVLPPLLPLNAFAFIFWVCWLCQYTSTCSYAVVLCSWPYYALAIAAAAV